jgi:hypothetical protein
LINAVVAMAPGVDHRIERAVAALVEHDRIERVAARLDADLAEDKILSVVFEREAVDERLRDRLDSKQIARVAGLVDLAVGGDERDAESIRIGLGQLRDVGRNLAVEVLAIARAHLLERGEYWRDPV